MAGGERAQNGSNDAEDMDIAGKGAALTNAADNKRLEQRQQPTDNLPPTCSVAQVDDLSRQNLDGLGCCEVPEVASQPPQAGPSTQNQQQTSECDGISKSICALRKQHP